MVISYAMYETSSREFHRFHMKRPGVDDSVYHIPFKVVIISNLEQR